MIEDCVKFLQKLVQTPSVNGKHSEKAVVDVIAAEAQKLGLPYRIIAKNPDRPNIFVGENFTDSKDLLLVSNLGTVPEGNLNAWSTPPFSGTINGGNLYGLGAIDGKGGIAISLYALKMLSQSRNLLYAKFVGVVDESANTNDGLAYLLEEGLDAGAAVYTYGAGTDQSQLTIGHRGLLQLWITCFGESVSSGSQEWQDKTKGEDAIEGINEFLTRAKKVNLDGKNKYFPGYHFVLTPTLIEGGIGESIVPNTARVMLDIRTLPEHDSQEIFAKISEITKDLTTPKRNYTIEVKSDIPGALTDPESEIVKRALQLNKEIYGVDSQISGAGPANESHLLIKRGIPTITGYGPQGGNFQAPNEYADLNSIGPMLQMLTKLAGSQ